MFNKNSIKENYDKNFEEFMSSDFSKASINNFIHSDIANNKSKVTNFWNDDDDSTSSMKIGTGKSYLKRAPITSAVNAENQNIKSPKNLSVNDVESDTQNSDLRLNINHSSDKSQFSNLNDDDNELNKYGLYAHPKTFEGLTDTMIDHQYSPTNDAGFKPKPKNFQNVTSETMKSNLSTIPIDKSLDNFQNSLEKTEKEHLLSKVSLLDSYDVHKHDSYEPGRNDSLKPDGDSYYKNSVNPASGDSYNYTQGITNITDTVIGDTTAADLAAIHKHYDKFINKESSELSPGTNHPISETIKEILDHSTLRYDDLSGINLESTLHSKSFGMKVIRPDQEPNSVSSPIPTPRTRRQSKISKSDSKDDPMMKDDSRVSVSSRKPDFEDKSKVSRYSHVKSSGYGTKPVTTQKTPTPPSKSQPTSVRARPIHQNVNQSMKMNGKTYTKTDQQSKIKDNPRSKSENYFNEWDINLQSEPKNETYSNRRNDDKENMYQFSHYPSYNENVDDKNKEWQERWLEERKIVKKLEASCLIQERDFKKQIESTTQKYEEKLVQLESQLTRTKQQLNSKPDFSSKVLGPTVTKEDIARIEREMKEQSSILSAYEKDNERLCQEIKLLKQQQKRGEEKVDSVENERLISQYVSLKAECDAKDIELRNLKQMAKENRFSRSSGNMENKESYLQEIAELKHEVQVAKNRYLQSEAEKQKTEMKFDKLTVERDKQLLQYQNENEIEKMERIKLLESHKLEVDDLKRKIKWYLENQAILDQNMKKIKAKDLEIAELKYQLQSANTIKISSNIRAKEKSADLAKLKKYEDEIMSLREDLYLLSKGKNIGNIAEKRTVQFLEDKIKFLEADNENASKKENNAFRSLQQQFEAMKFQYEEKINDLELDLIKKLDNKSNPDKSVRITELRSKIDELNVELEKKSSIISRLKSDLKKLNSRASNENLAKECKSKNIRTFELDNRTEMLRKELHDKETEIERLKIQNAYLKGNDVKELDIHFPRQSANNQLELEAENAKYKSQIVHLNRDIDNYKQAMNDMKMTIRQNEEFIRNEMNSEIRKLEEFHRENLKNVKMDYANRHSESDVANLKSQIEIQNNYIGHLQNQITEYNINLKNYETKTNELADAQKQLQLFKTELSDLRLIWSKKPGLEMIDRLRSKIIQLEEKENLKGRQLDEYIDKIVKINLKQYEDEVERWRTIVAKKNQNLLLVQNELNRLLEALEELRRQGIIIPNFFDKSSQMKHC